jgi:type VI protein secretion system component Hcp
MAIYLNLGGIAGDVTHSDYTNWINIKSMHWGMNIDVSTTVGNAANRMSAGKITPHDISLVKDFDQSTVPLMQQTFKGQKIPLAKVVVTQQASDQGATYLEYDLTGVFISSYQLSGSDEALPTEHITLNFQAINIVTNQVTPTGNQRVAGGYDFAGAKIA